MATLNRPRTIPPWVLAVLAMVILQLGLALSVDLIRIVGPAGAAWLRLSMAALLILIAVRPPLRHVRKSDIPTVIGLGLGTATLTVALTVAINHLSLGAAVSIAFLGPLVVAVVRSHNRRMMVWPISALVGVVLMTQPWEGVVSLFGVAMATAAAMGWAFYMLLTQRVGDRFTGASGLALTLPIAAVAAAFVGVPQSIGSLSPSVILAAAGLALLAPLLPFVLEMFALRRMTHTAFGTLAALEPAVGLLMGAVVLHQPLAWAQGLGICLVVGAGIATQRGGERVKP